ncbi:MAG TPA: DUF6452 family protein [Flavobacteriaceae bacterium]|nr:DUF6452 family protein [Flavobacteriaceae bacterium]
MKKVLFLIVIILALASCQHNDICTENQPTTPKLVIKFYNYNNPNQLKPVEEFNAREVNSENYYYENNRNDTLIKIPLRTNHQSTVYEFIINKDSMDIQQSASIEFIYTPEEIYINRPCGFRAVFENFDVQVLDNNPDTWIKAIEIPHENTINDEESAHLYIYH